MNTPRRPAQLLVPMVAFLAALPASADGDAVRTFDFGPHGAISAIEVLHTPGVWEGQIIGDGPRAGGWLMQVETNQGRVLVAQGADGSTLQAIPLGGGAFRVVGDESPMRGCGGAIEVPAPAPGDGGTAGSCDDGGTLDVLMRWTPNAQAAAGGETAIRAVAEASVAISNHVYMASGVNLRMRAVGYGITEAYSNDAGSGVLSELRTSGDGILDSVHADRDTTGADLVSLLTASNPSYCGIAYLVGSDVPDYGFSVVVWSCALGGLTFTHEIGHNQGCCHAPGDGGGCTTGGVFPYSVGHRFTVTSGTQFRTVLAYSPGTRCPRLSSPNTVFQGMPTGLPEADNARTLNETAAVMANYRCTVAAPLEADHVASPLLPFPLAGQTASFAALGVPRAATGTTVDIAVTAVGDLGQSDEALSLRIGSTNLGTVIGNTGTDCAVFSRRTSIPAATFNAAIGTGANATTFTLIPTSGVTNACSYSESRVVLRYRAAPAPCLGDLDGDQAVGGSDLGVLLGSWGACTACAADLNADGAVNGADIGTMLGGWGACP